MPEPDLTCEQWWRRALRAGEDTEAKPDWARTADEAIACADALTRPEPTRPEPIRPEPDPTRPDVVVPPAMPGPASSRSRAEAHFAPVVAPLVTVASAPLARLAAGDRLISVSAVADVHRDLTRLLCRMVARTMVAELHRQVPVVPADPALSRARFEEVVASAATSAGLARLAGRFPVLFRLLATQAADRVEAATELLRRWQDDRDVVVAGLLPGPGPGALTGLRTGAGDSHARGRSVTVLTMSDGRSVVYKPRPLQVHHAFDEILAELRAAAPDLVGRTATVLVRNGYGWMEFVAAGPCADRAGVSGFYRRTGALLAVAHVVRATDLHCENLIAAGADPILVDLETVLHPDRPVSAAAIDDPARLALARSVLRTSMVPASDARSSRPELSALGGDPAPTGDTVSWADAGLAGMRLVRRSGRFPGSANRPVLAGRPAEPCEYTDEILTGFRTAYDILAEAGPRLAAGPLRRLGDRPARLVVRDTDTYARLLDESTHPALLADPGARQRTLRLPPGPAVSSSTLAGEIEQLWHGDVPTFESVATEAPAVLSATDRDIQSWVVAASLAVRAAGLPAPPVRPRRLSRPAGGVSSLSAALAVADRMIATAFDDDRRTNWMALHRYADGTFAVRPMGADLANGYPGVALFLAELARITGSDRYREHARRAVASLPQLVRRLSRDAESARAVGAGLFDGAGGIAYALGRLARLLPGDDDLAEAVEDAVHLVTSAAAGQDLGVAGGRAGGLVGLLALRADGWPVAAAVDSLVDSLLADLTAGPGPAGGASRGELGLIWALRRAGATPPAGLAQPAGRAPSGAPDPSHLDELARRELGLAGRASRMRGADDSMLFGSAGRLEIATRRCAGIAPGRAEADALAADLAARTVAGDPGPRCATPGGVHTPGLLYGLAGIGHALLRHHDPESVPSVLAFDAPVRAGEGTPSDDVGRLPVACGRQPLSPDTERILQ